MISENPVLELRLRTLYGDKLRNLCSIVFSDENLPVGNLNILGYITLQIGNKGKTVTLPQQYKFYRNIGIFIEPGTPKELTDKVVKQIFGYNLDEFVSIKALHSYQAAELLKDFVKSEWEYFSKLNQEAAHYQSVDLQTNFQVSRTMNVDSAIRLVDILQDNCKQEVKK